MSEAEPGAAAEKFLIGVSLRPQYTNWPAMRHAARTVDDLGFDWLLTSDHLIASPNHEPDPDGPIFEGWQLLGAWAALTRRVRLGIMVSGVTLRHPAVMAKMTITLDHISGGRAICGLGAGWFGRDNETYGMAWGSAPERLARLDEAAHILRSLFDEPRTSFRGRHYSLTDAPASPKPLQRRLPMLIGGGGERRTLMTAARYADLWNTFGSPSVMAHKIGLLRRHCADIGRDPSAITPTVALMLNARESSHKIGARLGQYWRAGVRGVVIDLPAPYDLALLDRVAREVRPTLARVLTDP